MDTIYRHARKLIVLVIGVTVLLIGLALLVLPGPGMLVIIAGLALLGIEFAWARSLLKKLKEKTNDGIKKMKDFMSSSKTDT